MPLAAPPLPPPLPPAAAILTEAGEGETTLCIWTPLPLCCNLAWVPPWPCGAGVSRPTPPRALVPTLMPPPLDTKPRPPLPLFLPRAAGTSLLPGVSSSPPPLSCCRRWKIALGGGHRSASCPYKTPNPRMYALTGFVPHWQERDCRRKAAQEGEISSDRFAEDLLNHFLHAAFETRTCSYGAGRHIRDTMITRRLKNE